MDRDEQICLLLVGNGSAGFQRNEGIVLACVDLIRARPRLKQHAEPLGNVQNEIFFLKPIWGDGTCVMTAMAGVDDDLANLQPQCPDERSVTAGSGLGFVDIDFGSASEGFALLLAAAAVF